MKRFLKIGFSSVASAIALGMSLPAAADGISATPQPLSPSLVPTGLISPPTLTLVPAPVLAPPATSFPTLNLKANIRLGYSSAVADINYASDIRGRRLEASFEFPVDGQTLADSNAAVATRFVLQLGGVTCTMVIDNIHIAYHGLGNPRTETALYKISVYDNGSTITESIGNCANSSNATAFPVVNEGQTVDVFSVGNSATPLFIFTGQFLSPSSPPPLQSPQSPAPAPQLPPVVGIIQ